MGSKKRFGRFTAVILFIIVAFVAFQNIDWILKTIYPMHYRELIEKYADTYDIDPYLIAAIIRNESKFNAKALSKKDAKGLMQIAPITGDWAAERLDIHDYSEDILYDPEKNIEIGSWYLHILKKQFDDNLELVIAGYNAGNGRVEEWLKNPKYSKDGKTLDDIPFSETKAYLRKVLRDYKIYKRLYR